jgi:hypothetical protein
MRRNMHPSEKVVRVWKKTFYSPKSVIDVVLRNGEKFRGLSYAITLAEINCKDKRFRHLTETYYSEDGKVLVTYENLEWHFIVSESTIERLHEAVCK